MNPFLVVDDEKDVREALADRVERPREPIHDSEHRPTSSRCLKSAARGNLRHTDDTNDRLTSGPLNDPTAFLGGSGGARTRSQWIKSPLLYH